MSKKQNLPKTNPPKVVAKPVNTKPEGSSTNNSWQKWVAIFGLTIAVFVSYSGGFDNQFVDWDDHVYIENNYLVTQPQGHWGEAWKSHVALNYHPLTITSLMMNAAMSGAENPRAFIITNALIHLVNVLLVFWLITLLLRNPADKKTETNSILVPFFTALLFAIHPMRVESVTWISERKDVMYGLFFIAGCISYLKYLDSEKKNKYLIYSMLFLILSCFSKAQAVVLPVIFLLLDYWRGREFSSKTLLEKAPFFVVSLIFGLIATNIQSGGDFHGMIHIIGEQKSALNMKVFSLTDRLQYGGYGFMMYFYHLLFPFTLCTFYPYESEGANHNLYPVGLIFMILVMGSMVYFYKKSRVAFFSLGFFIVTVFLVLQFISVGAAVMADRYTYVPYIGLFFGIAMIINTLAEKNTSLKQVAWVGGFAFALFLFFITKQQTEVWQNTGTLFGRIIERFPKDYRAYYTRGKYLGEKEGKLDESIEHNLKAIELGYKDDAGPWENLGTAYGIKGDTKKALEYFSEAIKRGPSSGETYMNRGIGYMQLNQVKLSIPDFEKALSMPNKKPTMIRGMLGGAFLMTGDPKNALLNLNQVIDKEGSQDPVHFYNRGVARQQTGDNTGAIADLQKAIQLKPDYTDAQNALKVLGVK